MRKKKDETETRLELELGLLWSRRENEKRLGENTGKERRYG